MVGRGGLEPPSSAVDGAERCASNWEIPSVEAGVMWCEMSSAVEISRGVLAACSCQRALVWARPSKLA